LWTLSFTLEKAHSLYVIPICIDWSTLFFILSNILPLVNSCFSPCIYIVFLSGFREAAKRLVCRTTNRSVNKLRNAVELEPVDNREIQPVVALFYSHVERVSTVHITRLHVTRYTVPGDKYKITTD